MVTNKNVALVSHILKNRDVVYFGTRLQQAQDGAEKEKIMAQIRAHKNGRVLLSQLNSDENQA